MQHQHRARIQALEAQLEGYGFKPLSEDHVLDVDEPPSNFGESHLNQAFGLSLETCRVIADLKRQQVSCLPNNPQTCSCAVSHHK